jgi:flagellar biosynthesis/type III secretory pathway M-ring protein FliF/YscJ
VSEAPFDVSWPVIEKECLTRAEEGAELVRAVVATVTGAAVLGVFASSTGAAVLNNNAQTTSTATTITTLFSANIPPHLER